MRVQQIDAQRNFFRYRFFLLLILVVIGPAGIVRAQTTTFTYQGRFTDGGTPANGIYDMQFKLFDSSSVGSGNQIGSTITNASVSVASGVFTVQLDYGSTAFPGADRFLEIGVRLSGDNNPYTVLSPRQQLTSTPYAIRAGSATTADTATNTTQLGGVNANQYVQANDSRLTDARTPAAGSTNYIQNSTNQQAASNFNISGNGTLGGALSANTINGNSINGNTVNAGLSYNLGGNRFMGAILNGSTFLGLNAGPAVPNGTFNSYFGQDTGPVTTGFYNSFFGGAAGTANTSGTENSFFGEIAGYKNTTGNFNSFFGRQAGRTNTIGHSNTALGYSADVGSNSLTNATAVGANALATQNNALVLGSINGVNGAGADTNVGIGTTAPNARFHIAANGGNLLAGDVGCISGFVGIGFGTSLSGCTNYALRGNGTDLWVNTPNPGNILFGTSGAGSTAIHLVIDQAGVHVNDTLSVGNLGAAGSTQLCRNASNQVSTCSSSLRYKTNIQPFIGGLSVLNRLRPITFDWKQGGMHDLGFGAEDIAAVEPLLVTNNDKGEVEGVKYDRITAVLVNAVKEQQQQIQQQQSQIASLKKLVCQRHRNVAVCK